ncbi:MAG TPA: aldehyde ferredoxin oxidoreductase family protein [Candidatus Acidoferrales bacterium]|nr:aldehyde ferredoxin oxidoreductase family protein [Candidatus Acidoferrales bacterium]
MTKYKGYVGKILRVNLNKGSTSTIEITDYFAERWIGGRGFIAKILYDELEPGIDPLSPSNKLIFMTGPLAGTMIPLTGKYTVGMKSPLTKTISVSYCGGHFGPTMKFAGYDGVIFEGKSDKKAYAFLHDGKLELNDASHLWGKTTHETEDIVGQELGSKPNTRIASIGPAGENMVRIASIMSDKHAAAARGGPGAVMGSKNLKAFAVRGAGRAETYVDQQTWRETLGWIGKIVDSNEVVKAFSADGTTGSVAFVNELGLMPTRNFQTGHFEGGETIGADYIKKHWPNRGFVHCWGCRVLCSKWIDVKEGPNAGVKTDRPEHENIFALGSNCGVSSFETVAHANLLCDQYGMDTISAGVVASFAMECFERGLIKEIDTNGMNLKFGSEDGLLWLMEKIARREGIGSFLADGVKMAAEKMKPEASNYAMHVKGLEMPGYDPRGAKGIGLNYATASRGADHNDGWTIAVELFGMPQKVDRFAEDENKAKWVIEFQDSTTSPIDTAVFCDFCLDFGFSPEVIERLMREATGMDRNYRDLVKVGERIINVERLFNIREGYTRKDDRLPKRFLEPLPDGQSKGQTIDVNRMLDFYYRLRGWDVEGVPTKRKLEELELS